MKALACHKLEVAETRFMLKFYISMDSQWSLYTIKPGGGLGIILLSVELVNNEEPENILVKP